MNKKNKIVLLIFIVNQFCFAKEIVKKETFISRLKDNFLSLAESIQGKIQKASQNFSATIENIKKISIKK